ncbi:MAG: hypothetical protein NC453_26230 [Muribaculum sp.]|nr:hypothetical protein [Muribaculum sp.]
MCKSAEYIAVIEIGFSERSGTAYACREPAPFSVFRESLAVSGRRYIWRRSWLHPQHTLSLPLPEYPHR